MKLQGVFMLGIIIGLSSCRSFVTTTLEPELFEQTLMRENKAQLLDVRTPEEYIAGHIPSAVNMDVKNVNFDNAILRLDSARPVFVYCRSGKRSMEAAAILEKNKFKVVYNLGGGVNAWTAKGKAVTVPLHVQSPDSGQAAAD
jgi:rhodanese-related sulfurtransferase